jgi:GT2 family glycosyltransferase
MSGSPTHADTGPLHGLPPRLRLDLEASRAKLLGALADAMDVTVIRNYGHVGDQLIHAGLRRLLSGITYREASLLHLEDARGELAVVTGGGAWCRAHGHMPHYLPRIESQFERVIVFPSSFDVSVESVAQALRQSRALVFARERTSYEQIRALCRAELAHDTAFFFDFAPYRSCPGQGTLLSFRTDAEALGGEVPAGSSDVSLTCESLDEFLWTIARHEVVHTDRAHLMIAAALLGKRVHYGASNYHKVPALAAFGLQEYPVTPLPSVRAPSIHEQVLHQARAAEERLPTEFAAAHRDCKVTALMLSHERPQETCRAIRALQEHVRIPFRLLLWDNNSEPQTRRLLQELAAADERIQLVLAPENLGCAGGRAAALQKVQTEFVLLIDNDLEIMPGALEHLLWQLEQHPQAVAATGKVVLPDGTLFLCGGDSRVEGSVFHQELLGGGRRVDDLIGPSGPCRWVPGCLTLFRTACLQQHPYDLGMRSYYEDTEWCHRLNLAGEGKFYRCVEALGIHYHESKAPPASLPAPQRRRRAMPYLEALAHFYRQHELIHQDLPAFVPELGHLNTRDRVQAGRLLLELINREGSDWVLQQWDRGALEPLFLASQQERLIGSLQSQITEQQSNLAALHSRLAEREQVLEAIHHSRSWRLMKFLGRLRHSVRGWRRRPAA